MSSSVKQGIPSVIQDYIAEAPIARSSPYEDYKILHERICSNAAALYLPYFPNTNLSGFNVTTSRDHPGDGEGSNFNRIPLVTFGASLIVYHPSITRYTKWRVLDIATQGFGERISDAGLGPFGRVDGTPPD